ncbi:MAG: peptidoglycan-binding protein [Paludibacter sp.]|nr:peptidoglycan-binding protein [Paludibacter sp.]
MKTKNHFWKENKALIIITIVLIILAVCAVLWQTGVFGKLFSNTASSPALPSDADFPLKNGSRGDVVTELQRRLNNQLLKKNELNLAPLALDGIFGSKTESAANYVLGTKTVTKTQYESIK